MANSLKIDKLDVKILNEYESIDEFNYSKIGKKIRKSKSFVKYRIDRMFEENIIYTLFPIFNVSKLGYHVVDIYLLIKGGADRKKEIIEFYKNDPNVNYLVELVGKYNLVISFYLKNLEDYQKKIHEMTRKFEDSIYLVNDCTLHKAYHCRTNFLPGFRMIETHKPCYELGSNQQVSDNEKKIVSAFGKKPMATTIELAKMTKLSTKTVKNTIERLKKEGIINATIPGLNVWGLGFIYKLLMIEIKYSQYYRQNEIMNFLISSKNMIYGTVVLNQPIITCDLIFTSLEEYQKFDEELNRIFHKSIHELNYLDKFGELKDTYLPQDL